MLSGIYLKLIAAAVIIAAVIAGVVYVRHLQNENERLTAEAAVLSDKIATQNAAVEKLKTEGEERLKAAKADLDVAKAAAAKGRGRATIIYKTKPSVPGATCDADRSSALDLVNGGAK